MIGLAVLLRGTQIPRLAGPGGLLGIAASLLTATPQPLCWECWYFWEDFGSAQSKGSFGKSAAVLVGAFLFTIFCANAYVMLRADRCVCFTANPLCLEGDGPQTRPPLLGMPEMHSWESQRPLSLAYENAQLILVYAMLLVAYVATLRRAWNKPGSARLLPAVVLLAIAAAGLLAELPFSLNWLRLYAVSVPGIICSPI
jgi:hypothetical protein